MDPRHLVRAPSLLDDVQSVSEAELTCRLLDGIGWVGASLVGVTVVYFVAGVVVQKFVFKKEGVEMVPNSAFWLVLPGLIKVQDPVPWPSRDHSHDTRATWNAGWSRLLVQEREEAVWRRLPADLDHQASPPDHHRHPCPNVLGMHLDPAMLCAHTPPGNLFVHMQQQ
jgi:hypothetical protein